MLDKGRKNKYMTFIGLILFFAGIGIVLYPCLTNIYWHTVYKPSGPILVEDKYGNSSQSKANLSHEIILEIPQLNLLTKVEEGTSEEILKFLPGRYLESAWPGEGNTAIAGHRTLYGGQFRKIDRLKKGDQINLFFQQSTFVYEVEQVYQVASDDWAILDEDTIPSLTLTTCFKLGRSKRLVVKALLISQI